MSDEVIVSAERYTFLRLMEENTLSVFNWSSENQSEYNSLYDNFIETNGKDKIEVSDQAKGAALEDLVSFIFKNISIFQYIRNHHTSDFEIDIIVKLSPRGIQYKNFIHFCRYIDTYLVGECKNYNKNLSVTYTGKFYSLLKRYNLKFGIIFSFKGLTGQDRCKGWIDATGLTKKVYLKDNVIILDFNKKHFEKIKNGENFIDILNNILEQTILDINADLKFFEEHENIGFLE
jgi:predicted nucleotidyltransferase